MQGAVQIEHVDLSRRIEPAEIFSLVSRHAVQTKSCVLFGCHFSHQDPIEQQIVVGRENSAVRPQEIPGGLTTSALVGVDVVRRLQVILGDGLGHGVPGITVVLLQLSARPAFHFLGNPERVFQDLHGLLDIGRPQTLQEIFGDRRQLDVLFQRLVAVASVAGDGKAVAEEKGGMVEACEERGIVFDLHDVRGFAA